MRTGKNMFWCFGLFLAAVVWPVNALRANVPTESVWSPFVLFHPAKQALAMCVMVDKNLDAGVVMRAENDVGMKWVLEFTHVQEGVYCTLDTHFTGRLDVETIWIRPDPNIQIPKILVFVVKPGGTVQEANPATPWCFIDLQKDTSLFVFSVLAIRDVVSDRMFIGPPMHDMRTQKRGF